MVLTAAATVPWVLCAGRFVFIVSHCKRHLTIFCLFIYFWLRWVFVAVHRLSLATVSGDYSFTVVCGLLIVGDFSCCRILALEHAGFSSCAQA